METNSQRILVVGLPESGKSSFIQAVDEALKHPMTQNDLRSFRLADDRNYIQSGKENFLAGKKPGRTDLNQDDTSVELWFEHPPSKCHGRLHLPDKKGEIFRSQWVDRRWAMDYRENLESIAGALLFLRADGKSRNDELLGALVRGTSSSTPRAWDMKNASAQVQLVDVLQFMVEHGNISKPLRIAVLISAWDTVGQAGDIRPKNPAKFLHREWALLAQYLRANPHNLIEKIYGVSAYGGEPDKLGTLAELPAHERSRLTEGLETTRDLTRPLRWLLQLD